MWLEYSLFLCKSSLVITNFTNLSPSEAEINLADN